MDTPQPQNPYRFQRARPRLGQRVFIARPSWVSGDVVLEDDVSIWPMAVLRGDVHRIRVGARCNIQDGAVLHVTHEGPPSPEGGPLTLGADVTVGHRAILHACAVGARCLIGMGAIVMDGVRLGEEVMIGAGALVTPGSVLAPRTLWKGSPARCARPLTEAEIAFLAYSAAHYVRLKDRYLAEPGALATGDAGT